MVGVLKFFVVFQAEKKTTECFGEEDKICPKLGFHEKSMFVFCLNFKTMVET